MSASGKVILYVPGMKPKPPADIHRTNLRKCLQTALDRCDPAVAREFAAQAEAFRLAPWPHIFYPQPSDPGPDQPGLERLLAAPGPHQVDMDEASHWRRRAARAAYALCDLFPSLADWIASAEVKDTLKDSLRYLTNSAGVADEIRALVAGAIRQALQDNGRLLIVAHSLGSVVAFDTLWQLSREPDPIDKVDLLSLGSPLGLNFMSHRLLGADETGDGRYPHTIRHWTNLTAVGELSAVVPHLADKFRPMLDAGLVDEIVDRTDLFNYFRGPDGLNVHKCYGYMINPVTARCVADWWKES